MTSPNLSGRHVPVLQITYEYRVDPEEVVCTGVQGHNGIFEKKNNMKISWGSGLTRP